MVAHVHLHQGTLNELSSRRHSDLNSVREKVAMGFARFSFRYNNWANVTGILATRQRIFANENFLAGHLAGLGWVNTARQ